MEDDSSSELDSYSPGTIIWVKLPRFSWWPAEVVAQSTTDGRTKRELEIKTYGDSEEDSINFIKSPKMIKLYTCSEQKKLTEIGKKKYQNSTYQNAFDDAIDMANKKAGIEEEVKDTVEESNNQISPQTGNFEIKRRNFLTSDSTSTSNNCSYPKDSTPLRDVEYNNQHVELTSTPIRGSTRKCDSEIMLTPTRMNTPSRSLKRSQTTDTRQAQRQSKSRKRSRGQQNGEAKKLKQSSSKDNEASTNGGSINSSHDTPCDSSEDDLPAVSISQTPTKGFSSLKDIKSKDFVWVKHNKDPFWPALVMRCTATNVIVRFFYYNGGEYRVKNAKKILPYFCTEKEKFEEKCLHNPDLKEACDEALWLLRSGYKECGNTANEQFEAVEKRRSLSQVTPRKRMTYTTDEGSSSSSEDEPMESAFGYDITNNRNSMHVNNSNEGVDEESPKTVKSWFPEGSPYSYEILKENFTSLEPELYSIFKEEVNSENHRIFCKGSVKERNRIQVHNRCGPLFYLHIDHYNELQDMMVSWVKKWSDTNNPVHEVKYVSDVLFPEATVRTMMKVEGLQLKDAWQKFLSLDSIAVCS